MLTAVFSNGTGTVDHGIGSVTSGIGVSTGPSGPNTTYTLTVVDPFGDYTTAKITVGNSCYTFPVGAEPCTPAKDVSGGQIKDIGAGATCLRTADDFTGWNCSGMDDRTMKVNGTTVTCGGKPIPAKAGSFYYFDITAGTNAWAGFSWFCDVASCGPHSIPSCGHYPTWVSGGSVAPCADSTISPPDSSAD
jgi:hypothetical protein